MLGIAYASSIGGVGTIVGTAPNVLFVGQMRHLFPEAPPITFGQWIMFGIPLVFVFIPIAWVIITRVAHRLPADSGSAALGRAVIDEKLRELGSFSRGEKVVACVFLATVFAWVFRADIPLEIFTIPGWSSLLANPDWIDDGTVAISFALLLFMIPVDLRKGQFALEWEWARQIPWGVLLLFGGGFAIAKGFNETGLVTWVGGHLGVIRGAHPVLIVLLIATCVTILTEFMSNTALTNLMVPVLALSATSALHLHPLFVLIPATLSASLGFMMPAGTPPNALVFGSGYITTAQMMKTGFWLNVVGIVLVTVLAYFVVVPLFGIVPGVLPDWAH